MRIGGCDHCIDVCKLECVKNFHFRGCCSHEEYVDESGCSRRRLREATPCLVENPDEVAL